MIIIETLNAKIMEAIDNPSSSSAILFNNLSILVQRGAIIRNGEDVLAELLYRLKDKPPEQQVQVLNSFLGALGERLVYG